MTDYICARWRDANTDPPPHGWIGLNVMASGACYYGACGFMPGDQWLDITEIPAVPLEAVRKAVDEIEKLEDAAAKRTTEFWHGTEDGLRASLIVIKDHTGVTPTEE